MNIYEKIQWVKEALLKANLKKTGENKYAGFKYYELADFLPTIVTLCNEKKLFTKPVFENEVARLIIINCENPEEREEYTSPMKELELKGCNQIQALGGVETYQRRYLYMSAFDIVENDMFDGTSGKEDKSKKPTQSATEQVTEKKATEAQLEIIKRNYKTEEVMKKLLESNGIEKLEDLSMVKASEIITKLKELSAKKKQEEQSNGTNG